MRLSTDQRRAQMLEYTLEVETLLRQKLIGGSTLKRSESRKRRVPQIALLVGLLSPALCLGVGAREIDDFAPLIYDTNVPDVLRLQGRIDKRSRVSLSKALRHYPQIKYLNLSSSIGEVYASLSMALDIRNAGLKTSIPEGQTCYGACAFLFLAGVERSASGHLGVHQISARDDIVQSTVGDILTVLNDFDVPFEVIVNMFRTPANTMYVFSAEEIDRLGLTGVATSTLNQNVERKVFHAPNEKPENVLRPALDQTLSEALFSMGLASMRPYNCNFEFEDDTDAQYGTAFYKLITGFDSAEKLQSAQKAGKAISCERARFHASRAWAIYSKF